MTGRAGRIPPQITASYIENAAMHYLERFASSRANLRRVLMGKVRRSLAHWGGEMAEAEAIVDAVILRLSGLGYLDDAAYADLKARGLARRGGSVRAIRATLSAKGVEAETVAAALSELGSDPDRAAALAFARRRRLGPFRPPETRADHRNRDLASLGRAGFSWEIARAVIDGDGSDPEF